MTVAVLVLDVVFLLSAFGVRTLGQWRRTRDTGWRLGRPQGAAESAARACLVASGILLAVSVGVAFAEPPRSSAAAAVTDPMAGRPPGAAAGIVLAGAAIVLVLVAQWHMGASWRIGVDRTERTDLIRSGLYRSVRNPIYTGMVGFAVGQAVTLANAWSVAAAVTALVGVEIQVRLVEEPYLRDLHGHLYTDWSVTAGRFVPLVGRG
jgi:protein-S-isoprenylcysteine O-methyltransferase Ste14